MSGANKEDKDILANPKIMGSISILILLIWLFCAHRFWTYPEGFQSIFDGAASLFAGFAFLGLIYSLALQREESRLNRREFELNRQEMREANESHQKNVETQVAQIKALERQVEIAMISARVQMDNYLIERRSQKLIEHEVRLRDIQRDIDSYGIPPDPESEAGVKYRALLEGHELFYKFVNELTANIDLLEKRSEDLLTKFFEGSRPTDP